MKQKTKIITFEDEKRNEHIKLVFNAVLITACLICVMQAIMKAPMYFFIQPLQSRSYYFYIKTFFSFLFSGLSVFIPFCIYNKATGNNLKQLFTERSRNVPKSYYFLGSLAVTGASIVLFKLSVMLVDFMTASGFVINETYPLLGQNIYENVFFIIVSAVIPAFFNEITFRGIILQNLKKESYTAAVIISSIIFSFNNISFLKIPYLLITGLILGWLYLKTKSIFVTFTAHISMNIFLSFLWILKNSIDEYTFNNIFGIIVPVFGLVSLFSAITLVIMHKFTLKRSEPGLTVTETLKGIFLTSGIWIFLFITVFQLFFSYIDMPGYKSETEDEGITNESRIIYSKII